MCIIGYAPKNATISDETIKVMFENNPNGAGIMWKEYDKPVEIRKGFFDVKALLNAWHKIPIEAEKAVHCRIATAGKVSSQCCHPFPVRETTICMKERSTNTDMAFMHNGIIHLTDPPMGIRSPYSDSMMFGKEVLYPIKNALSNTYVQEMVEGAINNSRLLIFRQYGSTIKLGTWVKEGKCYFSNSTYKNTYFTYKNYGCSYSSKPAVITTVKKEEPKAVEAPKKNEPVIETVPSDTSVVEKYISSGYIGCVENDLENLTDDDFFSYYGCSKEEAEEVVDSEYLDSSEETYLDDETRFLDEQAKDLLVEKTIANDLKKEGEQVGKA